MRISEFAVAAGVSPRTIRYYVVEGLLPPPDGLGLGAMYGPGHADRLRLILRLKDDYLPLREIRRVLTGLDDDAVRRRLEEIDASEPVASSPLPAPAVGQTDLGAMRFRGKRLEGERSGGVRESSGPGDSAADYLARLGAPTAPASPVRSGSVPAAPTPQPAAPDGDYAGYTLPGARFGLGQAVPAEPFPPPAPPGVGEADADPAAESWMRLSVSDDVELLIRSGAYHRLRDRVEWLLGWARAIFR